MVNTRSEYGTVSRALHWIIVLAIVAQWLLAETVHAREPPDIFDSRTWLE